jgi:hypothetical protein
MVRPNVLSVVKTSAALVRKMRDVSKRIETEKKIKKLFGNSKGLYYILFIKNLDLWKILKKK